MEVGSFLENRNTGTDLISAGTVLAVSVTNPSRITTDESDDFLLELLIIKYFISCSHWLACGATGADLPRVWPYRPGSCGAYQILPLTPAAKQAAAAVSQGNSCRNCLQVRQLPPDGTAAARRDSCF
jgi:hypothetical protein